MLRKRNLYVIGSPIQLLGAIEAAANFPEHNNIFVIYLSDNNLNNIYIQQIIDYFGLKCIVKIRYRSNRISFLIRKCLWIRKLKVNFFENLFLGDFGEFSMKLFAVNIDYMSLSLLDDGTATLSLSKRVNKEMYPIDCFEDFADSKLPIKKLIIKLFSLKAIKCTNVNWFTMFEFQPLNGGTHLKHDFSYISSYFAKNSVSGFFNSSLNCISSLDKAVIFIGSSGVDVGVITDEKYYVDTIRKVRKFYSEFEFIYIPHRFENTDRLKPLVDADEIQILRLNNIIEIEFLSSSFCPFLIVSFYSTALYTLSILKPGMEIVFLDLDILKIKDKFRERVLGYESFFTSMFKKIKI